MKILFLDQFSDIGGAQRFLIDFLPGARKAGWEAHVAAPGDGPLVRQLAAAGILVHPISLGNYSAGHKTLRDGFRFVRDLATIPGRLRDLAEELGISVLYVNGPRLMPAVARAGIRQPVIFHAHNPVSAANGAALVRAAIRKTKATVIAASRSLGMPGRVVYSGVAGPGSAFTRKPHDHPRIGLIGRIDSQKCQKEFVLAAAILGSQLPLAEFVLCGDAVFDDPDAKRYKREVLALASPAVQYLGWIDDVYEVLAELDMLVVPSAGEGGVPRVILEAFAAGVPVLGLDSGGTKEVLVEGENGFLLRSNTPEAIAARIRELLANPLATTAAAGRARCLWEERFTLERYCADVWEIVGETSRRNTTAPTTPVTAVNTKAAG